MGIKFNPLSDTLGWFLVKSGELGEEFCP